MRNLLNWKIVAFGAVLAVVFGAGNVNAGDEHKKMEAKEVTLVGEVLDMYCYMKHPDSGQGAGHAKCAKKCLKKGLPAGYLADGTVYLLIGQDHEPINEMVLAFAGEQSRLKGVLVDHHGVKGIEVVSIEKADAKK